MREIPRTGDCYRTLLSCLTVQIRTLLIALSWTVITVQIRTLLTTLFSANSLGKASSVRPHCNLQLPISACASLTGKFIWDRIPQWSFHCTVEMSSIMPRKEVTYSLSVPSITQSVTLYHSRASTSLAPCSHC